MELPTNNTHPFIQIANKEDYLLICDAALKHAQVLKATYGATPIFGIAYDVCQKINVIQWPLHMPFPPESLKTFVLKSIYEQIDALTAIGVCSEVEIGLNNKKASALQIELSHVNGVAMKVYRGLTVDAWAAESGIDYFKSNRR